MKIASFSIADYCEATAGMPHDAERLYFRMLLKMLSREGGLPDNDKENAHMFGYDVRVYRKLKARLLKWPKAIYLEGGLLKNARVEDDIVQYRERRAQAVKNGRSGGHSKGTSAELQPDLSGTSAELQPDFGQKSPSIPYTTRGENNDLAEASPSPTPSPNVEEDDDVGAHTRAMPVDGHQGERPATGGVLVKLDDHRPDPTSALTEDHYRDFQDLCDTFGRKQGAMVITPMAREESDRLLADLVRTELRHCDPEIARRAIEGGLRNTRARSLGNRQDGHAGRGAGGVVSANRYLAKAVRSEIADLRIAEAAAIAKMHTEEAVQIRAAEKRMNGVERGGGGGRKRGSSWEDLGAEVFGDCQAERVQA